MILNLAYPELSTIKFTVSKFPDGQQSLTLIDSDSFELDTTNDTLHGFGFQLSIISRLNSFEDLELIICATQALKTINNSLKINLQVPYFLGTRSDRKFTEGGVNYLKQVIGPIINSQNFHTVNVFDPHSDVLEACINNLRKENNHGLVKFALRHISNNYQNNVCLVSPDAGAYKKIFDVAMETGIKYVVTASKVRDLKTGEILKTEIPNLPVSTLEEGFKYVIVDDICDGGRTFIELAKVIKEQRPEAKIYLVVTHGIFSSGFDWLAQYFEGIYTTNSVKHVQDGTIVNTFSKHKTIHSLVKQLNVF